MRLCRGLKTWNKRRRLLTSLQSESNAISDHCLHTVMHPRFSLELRMSRNPKIMSRSSGMRKTRSIFVVAKVAILKGSSYTSSIVSICTAACRKKLTNLGSSVSNLKDKFELRPGRGPRGEISGLSGFPTHQICSFPLSIYSCHQFSRTTLMYPVQYFHEFYEWLHSLSTLLMLPSNAFRSIASRASGLSGLYGLVSTISWMIMIEKLGARVLIKRITRIPWSLSPSSSWAKYRIACWSFPT